MAARSDPGPLSAVVITVRQSSVTVTVKRHVAWFVEASVAVQMTVVEPMGKVAPLGGAHAFVTPRQLSVAVGVKLTTAPPGPEATTEMFVGHTIVGGSASRMVTVNAHVARSPALSVVVQVTVVEPLGNGPLGGVHPKLENPNGGQCSSALMNQLALP